jgi:pimeloyl-ACP methyl ester carboxylesterase
MNPFKISFSSSILYDKYGNDTGKPILILEDIFLKNGIPIPPVDGLFFREYCIYHIKGLAWESFPFLEKSFLQDISQKLEEIILNEKEKVIIIAQGYSSGLAMEICQKQPNKVQILHLLSPILLFPPHKETSEHYKDFWDWWVSGKSPMQNFYQLPSLAEFFWKYLRLIHLLSNQEYDVPFHFWLTESVRLEDSIALQIKFRHSEVNRIEACQSRELINDKKVQKILAWKLNLPTSE